MIQWNKLIRKIKISLFDVDKTNADRGTPRPDSHDQIIDGAVKAHATHSINPVSNATTDTGYISNKNQQVLAFDGTANKALMGYNPGLDKWGMFVGKDGVDVTTNSDPANLIFNSSQDVFKIVATGNINSPALSISNPGAGNFANGSATTTVAHGLSFAPLLIAFGLDGSKYAQLPYTTYVAGIWETFYLEVDATNVYFSVQAMVSGTGLSLPGGFVPAKYYLLQETAN